MLVAVYKETKAHPQPIISRRPILALQVQAHSSLDPALVCSRRPDPPPQRQSAWRLCLSGDWLCSHWLCSHWLCSHRSVLTGSSSSSSFFLQPCPCLLETARPTSATVVSTASLSFWRLALFTSALFSLDPPSLCAAS